MVIVALLLACVGEPPARDLDFDGSFAVEDCDDIDPHVNPDAVEACNGIDDDCDGIIDPDDSEDALAWWGDADADGWGAGDAHVACDGALGEVDRDGDCDDTHPGINPDAGEICGNGIDDDCDDAVDEECE